MFDELKAECDALGKPDWRPMLHYLANLHERSTHPARPPFPFPWEEIGPGYCYRPAFGHWDIVHAILDVLPSEPEHARNQLLNNLAAQQDDGLIPGSIYFRDDAPQWNHEVGHPAVWPMAADDYHELTKDPAFLQRCYDALTRQITWFEIHRAAENGGFFYCDIVNRHWESGIDIGIRFDDLPDAPYACVDATAHVFLLYDSAARWAECLGLEAEAHADKAAQLSAFIQDKLWNEDTSFFHDAWLVGLSAPPMALEGMWPVVVGAASEAQAERVIEGSLLNPERFFSTHPIASVGVNDPRFQLRCWRGPTWNSMALWAARGCLRYGFTQAARALVEHALDATARQFERTGTIWEFYHPHGGPPEEVERKPKTSQNIPCRDYVGHNPLIEMARVWEATVSE